MGSGIVQAFTEEQVERLTGVTVRQLRYWDRTGFFQPEYVAEDRSGPYSRIYSYLDLVSLKVIARLRTRVPLQRLRVVKEELAKRTPELWRGTKLWVQRGEVVFFDPETGEPEEIVSGQKLFKLDLSDVTDDLDEKLRALRQRDETDIGRIERGRRVLHNKPVIAGTRIPVEAIRSFHEAGYTIEQIIAEYPTLTPRDIEAALADDQAA